MTATLDDVTVRKRKANASAEEQAGAGRLAKGGTNVGVGRRL